MRVMDATLRVLPYQPLLVRCLIVCMPARSQAVSQRTQPETLVGDGLLTTKEAAEFLGISVAGLYAIMARGELPFVKLGRSRRVPRRALIELAARNLTDRHG